MNGVVLLDEGNNLALPLFQGKGIVHSDRAEINLVATTVCGLLGGQRHEDAFREVDTDIYMAIGTMGDADHCQCHAVDTDSAAHGLFRAVKQHVGHAFTDDTHLAVLAHVDIVDEAADRDPLRNQMDKLGVNSRYQILVTMLTPNDILVTRIVDGAIRLHQRPEALTNQLLVV